jgi:hypothetical protein
MAFIVAGIVAVLTTLVGFVNMMGTAMGDLRGDAPFPWQPFAIGYAIAGLIAGSHYIHLGW